LNKGKTIIYETYFHLRFLRGGDWSNNHIAGSFAFDRYYGDLHGYGSFRLVLSATMI